MYKNRNKKIIDINDVSKKYFDNWKIKDIAKYWECSWQQIGKIIWKEIKSRRPHIYKYKINHNYFDVIDTENKAYILGFLYADGCVFKSQKSLLTISLQEKDKEIIEKIKLELSSTSPIETYMYKNKLYCRVCFYSEHLCNTLKLLGCVPLKSEYLKWNEKIIPKKLINHFIRGYFDGDGHFGFWFYKEKYLKSNFNITSTLNFCCGISKFIKKKFGYNSYMSKRHKISKSVNRTIEFSGNKQITCIMKWIYKDANIYLTRKKEKFDEFIKIYE